MPKIQLRSNPIAKYIYNQDIKIGSAGSFKNKKIFEDLCHIMVQIADHEQHKKGLQNLKYSDQFSDFLVILASLIKKLADTIKYDSPIIAMSDNTKIKKRLGFSSLFGCIVDLTLSTESTRVSTYKDIH
ncbi:23515_t:CDS:2 [Gigaspora margarita]|uniref:23515_t:CDS:1 n=1 Tax=Gigaspora margarita TaxID=4874 RepID=A0ABN7VVZ8_GIGMA|nr:23515_t:CDS:2 [Gigaspora margarita]